MSAVDRQFPVGIWHRPTCSEFCSVTGSQRHHWTTFSVLTVLAKLI